MSKSALVTGAKHRIGQAIAQHLKKRGIGVITHARSKEDNCDLYADLTLADETKRMAREMSQHKSWSILINSASAFSYDHADDIDFAKLEETLKTNLTAPLILSQALHKHAKKHKTSGLIIHILDSKLSSLNPDFFSYTVSRLSLEGALKLQARAYAPQLRVNAISPGLTLVSGRQTAESFARAHVANPLKQGVEIKDLLLAIDFLIDCPTVTGQQITVDAGAHLLHLERDVAFL